MLAAVTDGQTRQQILDALGAESLELLQKQTAQLWTENSWDDGLVTSVLANSIWLRDEYSYNEETLQKLGEEFYASAFSGEMGTDAYNNMLRDWINEHTGNLLTEQASGLELAPATVWRWCRRSITVRHGATNFPALPRRRTCFTRRTAM